MATLLRGGKASSLECQAVMGSALEGSRILGEGFRGWRGSRCVTCKEAGERFSFKNIIPILFPYLGMLWELVVRGLTVPAAIPAN